MYKKAFDLLKEWCDTLISYQITELKMKEYYGGILCPACGLMHGRIVDLVYPMTYLFCETKDKKYLDCAVLAANWTENNMRMSGCGLYLNDFNNGWYGISVFAADSLYEALECGKNCLPKKVYKDFEDKFLRLSGDIEKYFCAPDFKPNINYFAAGANVMANAYKITVREKYLKSAKCFAAHVMSYITEDGMLYGEGFHGADKTSDKGFRAVDIGYNIEESLPALLQCGITLNDKKIIEAAKKAINATLYFMLPDGGIINTFGARLEKWTYYGSRTSDGMQNMAFLTCNEPMYIQAAKRNFMQYKKCTVGGLLAGGKMHGEAGQAVCIHHSFTHAKSLVNMCRANVDFEKNYALPLDSDKKDIKYFKSIGVHLVTNNNIRAAVYSSDYHGYVFGQSMAATSILWHKAVGTVFISTMIDYESVEPKNMQYPKGDEECKCFTPRIVLKDYSNVYNNEFDFSVDEEKQEFAFLGKLCNRESAIGCGYNILYKFLENGMEFKVTAENDAEFYLPLISTKDELLTVNGTTANIKRNGGTVFVTAESKITTDGTQKKRWFNPVGGFSATILKIPLKAKTGQIIKLEIE